MDPPLFRREKSHVSIIVFLSEKSTKKSFLSH